MSKTKRVLSFVTSFTIAASAFSAFVIQASAETDDLNPTFDTYLVDGDTSDYSSATELRINQKSKVALLQFDASSLIEGKTITDAKLSINIASRSYNADRNRWESTAVVLESVDAGTLTAPQYSDYSSMSKTTISNNQWSENDSSVGSDGTPGYHQMDFDVTSYVADDADGLVTFALGTITGREQAVASAEDSTYAPVLTVETSDAQTYTITVNNVAGENIIQSYTIDDCLDGSVYTATKAQTGYKVYDGKTYVMEEGANTSLEVSADNTTLDIPFVELDSDVALYEDFCNISDNWGFTNGKSGSVVLKDGAIGLTQYNVTSGELNEYGYLYSDVKDFDSSISELKELDLTFDWTGKTDGNTNRKNAFELRDTNNNVIFGLASQASKGNSDTTEAGVTYNVGAPATESSATNISGSGWATGDSGLYTISLHLDFTGANGKVSGSIKGGVANADITIPETEISAMNLGKIVASCVYSLAPQELSSFEISAVKTADEPTTAPTETTAPTATPTAAPTAIPTAAPSVDEPATGEELINEDFTSTTGAWGFEGNGGANIENGYLVINTNNKNGALTTKTLDDAIKSADSLSIKFDWASNVETGKDRNSAFELRDSNNVLLFAMYGKGGSKTDSGIKYGLVDGTWNDIESHTTGKWYTVELNANFAAKKMSVSIKDTASGTELVNVPSVDITAENLASMVGNDIYSLAPQWIDNVLIKTPDTYALNVTVEDTDSNPVEGVTVEAVGSGKSAVTDAEGKAMLVLQNGNYTIKASKPGYSIAQQETTVNGTSSCDVALEYVGEPVSTTITISGGDEYVYQPKEGGQNKTVTPYAAVVYDQTGQVMADADVAWSINGAPTGASIDTTGIITIDSSFNVTDINGQDITVVATSGSATAETTIHVRQAQKLSSFAVAGANVIKYGKTAEYSVVDEKDQYGADYGYDDVTYTLTATNATTDGMNVTATDAGTQLSDINVTITSSNDVKAEKAVTGYGYDFYEPGVGETTYADENTSMITLGDENVLAWPTTPGTGYIVLPDPVELTPGSAKVIKFKLAETTQALVSQIRTLDFQNAEGVSVFADGKLWNANGMLGFNPVYQDKMYQWLEGSKPVGNIGAAQLSTWVDCQILIKTANDGVSTVIVDVGGDKAETTITADDGTGARVDEISRIELVTGVGIPEVRNLAIKDIMISDSDVAEVEIAGDDHIAKAEGKVATKSYRGAVYTSIDGETFTWSVSGEGTEGGAGTETTKAEFNLYKAAENDMTAVAIFPVYDENGVLKSLTTEPVEISKGATTISIDADADDTVFLWNSLDDAEPLAPKATIKTVTSDSEADVTIDQNGVLSVKDTAKAGSVVTIRYTSSASTEEAPRYAEKQVTINDFANVDSFEIDGPAAVNAGDTATYEAVNIKDEYGDIVDLNTVYSITEGTDIATIDPVTGVLTTSKDKTGNITVSVTVGNTGKTKTIEKAVYVGAYSVSGIPDGDSVEVDVTNIANYSANTDYLVTTAKDGVIVNQTETKATDGKVVVDTTGADAYEVSPIYFYDNVGNVSAGKEIALADGYYDFTFKKANGTRADIYVNGYMVGQNVDQYGAGRSTSGSYYTVKDVKVSGGSAVVTMKDNTSDMTSIEVKKSPSIVDRKTHVYILGDSLVANYYDTFADEDGDGIPAAGDAQTGWGQVFDKYVTDEMNVTNLAESGNYAKGLYDSVFNSVIFNSEPGDYLLFECGYNDRNYSSAAEMQDVVKLVQQACDEKGITVVFVTPNASVHDWKASVSLTGSLIEVCNEIGAKYIDLSGLSYAYYSTTKASNEESNAYALRNFNVYFNGASQDSLHSSYLGAMKCAEIVAQGIYDMQKTDETLAGLKINTEVKYDLKDSEGNTITMQVK